MKKWISVFVLVTLILALCACAKTAEEQSSDGQEAEKWDCSVVNAKESEDNSYIITYSDQEIISSSGALTFQNQNEFKIAVHLLCAGAEEKVIEIEAGDVYTSHKVEKGAVYTVGCHGDVDEGIEIKLMVYDGEIAADIA